MTEAAYPPVGPAYELRFTQRALGDLRCGHLAPGDLTSIESATPWPAVVRDFREQRGESPATTGGALARMGRGDVYPLHGPHGGRAATWFDPVAGVCWFLGYSPAHDYTVLEVRAANGELLPDEDDEILLELEREELDFELRVRPGLQQLVTAALRQPRCPARGTVGQLVRLEVTAVVVPVAAETLVDLTLVLRLPPTQGSTTPPGWPGPMLLERLAELATDQPADTLELAYPSRVPLASGDRPLEPAHEMAVAVINWQR